MSKPLQETWGKLWGRLTGRSYYRPNPYSTKLNSETRRFIHRVWQYHPDTYEQAQDLLASGNLSAHFHYRHFKLRKDDGDFRELAEPDPALKTIQKQIIQNYLRTIPVHQAAMGYRPKRSIAEHVWAHVGARYIITADIQDFFPSTHHYRIHEFWASQFSNSATIELATLLTSYQGALPQGAPTSPALSNIINYALDEWFRRKLERSGAVYTRYVDDMVFSWHGNNRPPADIRQSVVAGLHEFGYELKAKKWHEYRAEDEPEITGVILRKHGKVTIPDDMLRKIRQLERENPESPVLAGYRGFRKMIEKH